MNTRYFLLTISLWFTTHAFNIPTSQEGYVDLVIFSRNRPLQLTALLESVEKHITGLKTITVFCHTENDDFLKAYNGVQKEFPYVKFVMQERANRMVHFKKQLLGIITSLNAPYVMFAVDDIMVIDKVDLRFCCISLQNTHAYSFHLRVGKDITHSSKKMPMPQPPLHGIKGGLYAWYLHEAHGFDSYFGYPYSVDMTIFPSEMVVEYTKRSQCVSPNSFEGYWNWNTPPLPKNTRALCYPTSRIVNIELNVVQEGWSPNSPCIYSAEQLLEMYNKGLRINVDALFQAPHTACHANLIVEFRNT